MKSVLTHSIVAIVAVVLTSLLMKQCSQATVVTNTVTTIDTVYSEVVHTTTDTIYQTEWKTKYDTVKLEVPVADTVYHDREAVYAYSQFYKDSSLQVIGNIFYEGRINRHDQMLVTMKEDIVFIPTTKIYHHNRDILKRTTVVRQPRFLAGAYVTADALTLQQAGVSATLVDNKFRQYTVGKDLLNEESWMAEVKFPLFFAKHKR